MECNICASPIEPDDKYCFNCGHAVIGHPRSHDFEIGKIAALSTIKKDILTWFGGAALFLTIIVGFLAFFGLDRSIEIL